MTPVTKPWWLRLLDACDKWTAFWASLGVVNLVIFVNIHSPVSSAVAALDFAMMFNSITQNLNEQRITMWKEHAQALEDALHMQAALGVVRSTPVGQSVQVNAGDTVMLTTPGGTATLAKITVSHATRMDIS